MTLLTAIWNSIYLYLLTHTLWVVEQVILVIKYRGMYVSVVASLFWFACNIFRLPNAYTKLFFVSFNLIISWLTYLAFSIRSGDCRLCQSTSYANHVRFSHHRFLRFATRLHASRTLLLVWNTWSISRRSFGKSKSTVWSSYFLNTT